MIDAIEFWADTHPFVACCLVGFVLGVVNAIDPFFKPSR
jgi:hypothetical protein